MLLVHLDRLLHPPEIAHAKAHAAVRIALARDISSLLRDLKLLLVHLDRFLHLAEIPQANAHVVVCPALARDIA